jgi:glycine betaine catabolism A
MTSTRIREFLKQCKPGYSLPQEFYKDRDIYDFDVAKVLGRAWLMVGFEAELPTVGSYLATTIGEDRILLVRGRDRVIRGFHNTCRHRGSQICADGAGQMAKLVCPYHQWTYELDGRLVAAPRMPANFVPSEHRLATIGVGVAGGCVYVSLSEHAPDFAPFSDALEPMLAPFGLSDAKLAHQSVLMEQANWKLVMENARECYHCAVSHPELKLSFPVNMKPGYDFTEGEHNQRFIESMRQLGLDTDAIESDWWHIGRYPLNPGFETMSLDGNMLVSRRLASLDASSLGGLRWATEANSFCHVFADYAMMFAAVPIGPQETRVTCKWLVHRDAREGTDYDIERLTELWTATNLQDRALSENNQRGVNSRGYVPGPYSEKAEDFLIRFNHWYLATAAAAAA